MSKVIGVLIDTVSIQKYVFSSNKLKANIGASNIVENIYKKSLLQIISRLLGKQIDFTQWFQKPEIIAILDPEVDFEIGYIGGGNALLFFREREMAKEVIKAWTRSLLLEAPGLKTAVAIGDVDFDYFQQSAEELHKQLKKNKNTYFPRTELFKHSITADCPVSGWSAESFERKEQKYLSAEILAKYDNIETGRYESVLGNRYCLTDDLDNLGQAQGENYIAIVHIDGNYFGEMFKSCNTLEEIRRLSSRISELFTESFNDLLRYIIANMEFLCSSESGLNIKKKGDKYILPIRPILNAGDDITFICEGKLGVHLAEKFLRLMKEKPLSKDQKLSACAGIAITKTKYPFYMAYELAENLCTNAKNPAYKERGTSWLDFQLIYSGFSNLNLRNKPQAEGGRLRFGPYLVDDNTMEEHSIKNLKEGIRLFQNPQLWPRSKVKELRTRLTTGKEGTKVFLEGMKAKGINLYRLPGYCYEVDGFIGNKTPYFDMVELMEFYLPYFLDK